MITSFSYGTISLKAVPANQAFVILHYLSTWVLCFSLICFFPLESLIHMPHFIFATPSHDLSHNSFVFCDYFYSQLHFVTHFHDSFFATIFCTCIHDHTFVTTFLQLPHHATLHFLTTIISCNSMLFCNMLLTFLCNSPNCDSFVYISQMHHTPPFHITYASTEIQTYVWTTPHALHVATHQHDLGQTM